MPAILVENGFVTNRVDADLLGREDFRRELVMAMGRSLADALNLSKTGTAIFGEPEVTVETARTWARRRGAHRRFVDIAYAYWHFGRQSGIRPEVAYAQAARETAFGNYGGSVGSEQNNWAGIKTRDAYGDRPGDHETFDRPEEGVRGHYNHLGAYTGIDPIGEPHGRWYVVRELPWAGTVKHAEDLGGKWAPDEEYGRVLVSDYIHDLRSLGSPNGGKEPVGDFREDLANITGKLEEVLESLRGML